MATGDSNDMVRGETRYRSVNAEIVTFAVPTQNRFVVHSGRVYGQDYRDNKRKKVCSDGRTEDELDRETQRFLNLTTNEKLLCLFEAINLNFETIDNIKSMIKSNK
ncbi:hypothetical protein DPMN_144062 [Dreissena polymorpha]|uniref:Uncharacterized protein n=1 Tax=Dreissena polymorpha TaxID=45954 RepID=A0A9D4GHG8_DREPO|nr:hypothetical protein DPMN_144062 [Dreissena polymorpha]